MKTLGPKTNFRVVLTPRGVDDYGWFTISSGYGKEADARREQEYQERCEEMVRDAKRHVDNLQYAEVEFDQEPVCSYCGHGWTEKSPTYNGGCCAKDEDNNPDPDPEYATIGSVTDLVIIADLETGSKEQWLKTLENLPTPSKEETK